MGIGLPKDVKKIRQGFKGSGFKVQWSKVKDSRCLATGLKAPD